MGTKLNDQGNGVYGGTAYVHCYHPPTYVVSIDDCEIWAGRNVNMPSLLLSAKIDPDKGFHLALNCTGSTYKRKKREHEFPKGLKFMAKYPFQMEWEPVPEINFDMPDGQALWELSLDFWQEIIKRYKNKRILVYCVGGHGRTGTVISALMASAGCDNAVEMCRKYHCEEAVETESQLYYIKELEKEWTNREDAKEADKKKVKVA